MIDHIGMVNENNMESYIRQLRCSQHHAKSVQVCTDSICVQNATTFLCQLCYMSHRLDHKESKLLPVSELFSTDLLESLKEMMDQNKDIQLEKIDKIYDKLQKDFLDKIANSRELIKAKFVDTDNSFQSYERLKKEYHTIYQTFSISDNNFSKEELKVFLSTYMTYHQKLTDFIRNKFVVADGSALQEPIVNELSNSSIELIQKIDEILTQLNSRSTILASNNKNSGIERYQGISETRDKVQFTSSGSHQHEIKRIDKINQSEKIQNQAINSKITICDFKSQNQISHVNSYEELKNNYLMQAMQKLIF